MTKRRGRLCGLFGLAAIAALVSGCFDEDLNPVPEPPSFDYRGVVTRPDGSPIGGATVSIEDDRAVYTQVKTDADGRFSFVSHLTPKQENAVISLPCYAAAVIAWPDASAIEIVHLKSDSATMLDAKLSLTAYGLPDIIYSGNLTFKNTATGKVYSDPAPSVAQDGSEVSVSMPVDPGTYVVDSAWVEEGYMHTRYSASFRDWSEKIAKCQKDNVWLTINARP